MPRTITATAVLIRWSGVENITYVGAGASSATTTTSSAGRP